MSDLPSGWALATLEVLAAAENRAITDGPFGTNLKTAHYTDDGPRVIRLQNIGDGEFIDERAHISEGHFESLRAYEAKAGDLIVASLGADLPRSCIVPQSLGPAIVKADCIRVRLHREINARFVNYALQRPELRHAVADHVHGVGRPRLGMKGIRYLTVPIAPRREQDRIVEAIEELLPNVDAADGSLRQARTRLQAFDRASLALAQREGEETTVGEILDDIEAGKSFKTPGRRAEPGEWGIIKVSAMTWGRFREDENKAVTEASRIDPRYEINPGDLLLSRANTSEYVGATVFVEDCRPKLLLSDKSMRLIPLDAINRRWLRYALCSPQLRGQMSAVATGTSDSMRNISQAKVRALTIRVPSPDLQREQVARIQDLEASRLRLAAELQRAAKRSESLRRAVLGAAFSGQLVPPQAPSDEPATALIERIRAEKPTKKRRSNERVSW